MPDPNAERLEILAAFVREHPGGWHHAEWEGLLDTLRARGLLGAGGEEELGLALERERARQALEALDVPGLGPKRRAAILDAYPRLWDLRQATVEEIAALPSLNRSTAEGVVRAFR